MKMHKAMTNLEIASLLEAVSAAYHLQGQNKNRFKIIAYDRASDAVEHLSSEAKDLWDDGKLEEVAGIGKSIAGHLDEIFRTGKSKHFEEIMKNLPPAMFELIKISGVGPKTAYKITSEFKDKFKDKDAMVVLQKLAETGEISKMDGFTNLTEKMIISGIKEIKGKKIRMLLPYAMELADELIEWLKSDPNTQQVDPLGSIRRRASTVGDLDFALAAKDTKVAIEHFCNYPKVNRVVERGERSASIMIPGDRRVDLIVCKPEAYGSLLQHFTGSKHHNIALREYALHHNLSLSDYGIKKLNNKAKIKSKNLNKKLEIYEYSTEKDLYNELEMTWIPPELREDQGEIELALKDKLPNLIELGDVKADLQIHSDFDIETSHDVGVSTMTEIVDKADSLGYEYIAFTEHNPSKRGHDEKQIVELLKRKKEVINQLNADIKGCKNMKRVFNSLEIDMLTNGGLPVTDKGLELLDFALISIHSSFRLNRKKMTDRVLKSLEHPKAKIFAHPTGRILNQREGVELDWEKIFDYCKANDKWIEINAAPSRLDLPDVLIRDAINKGISLTLGTDSHEVSQMDNMQFGVYAARRGWCQPSNIVNTRSLEEFEKMIE